MKKNIIFSLLLLTSCADLKNSQFRSISSQILGSTGYVQSSEVDSLFDAGESIAKASRGFSPEETYYLGRGVSAMMFGKYQPYRSRGITEYLNSVGTVLASASPMPSVYRGYHFAVLDTDEVNAMSAPGGFVFVTRGLLRLLPDEDAVAGVLAHEVAHIVAGDGVAAISQSNVTKALSNLGKSVAASRGGVVGSELTSIFGDSVGQVFETLTTSGFSRSQEYDADALAVKIMESAGYNPNALLTVMDKLKEAKARSPKAGWFSTHPDPDDRKDELEDEIKNKDDKVMAVLQSVRAKRWDGVKKGV